MSEPTTSKPTILPVIVESIPEELRRWPQWAGARLEWDPTKGRWSKTPYNVHSHGIASNTDRRTWARFEDVMEAYVAGKCQAILFALSPDDPFVAADFDGYRDAVTGILDPRLAAADGPLSGLWSYTEASPSGTGVRVLVRADLGDRRNAKHEEKRAELVHRYAFVSVTGQHLPGYPLTAAALSTPHAPAHGRPAAQLHLDVCWPRCSAAAEPGEEARRPSRRHPRRGASSAGHVESDV
jgi:primase-polymerase (primpol)-like protein